nr:uncharacterized protein LOC112013892 [Quercus suber]
MDRLSELPDEIIICILSFLKLKEAEGLVSSLEGTGDICGNLRNVKRLSLDFNPIFQKVYRGYYTLPTQIPHGYSLDSLTNLCLSYVEVIGEVLNYILSNCPCIEALHVESSASLVNLKPSRPLLKLKHLEILRCVFLKEIEISAVNLVSFKYFGLKIRLHLGDVPSLVDVSVEGLYASYFVQKCCPISSYLSQLQTIVLDVYVERFPKFPELRNLRQLTLIVSSYLASSLLCCTSMLKAPPFLHKFTLELIGLDNALGTIKEKKAKYPHQCLKMLELIGFVGGTLDMELVLDVLINALSLEAIIIDTRIPFRKHISDLKKKLTAIARARQLETTLLPGIKMVIV